MRLEGSRTAERMRIATAAPSYLDVPCTIENLVRLFILHTVDQTPLRQCSHSGIAHRTSNRSYIK